MRTGPISLGLLPHWRNAVLVVLFICGATITWAQPANDAPCNAVALPVNGTCVNTNGTVQNATGSGVATPSCGNGNQDVWYTVVVPASGNITVTAIPGASNALNNGGMAFYTVGNCSTVGSFTEVACNDDAPGNGSMPSITLGCQTPGTTLYVRLWKQSGFSSSRNFQICAIDPGAGPANDDPCGATPLTVNTSCTNTTSTTLLACPTGVTNPSCAGYGGGDVWFSVVVPAGGTLTFTTSTAGASALTDGGMAVYSAPNCSTFGSFTQLACDDNSGPGSMPAITLTGQTPGQVLYVRFWENGNNAAGSFNICVTQPVANDGPCGAISLTVNSTCVNGSYTNAGATNTSGIPAPGCGNFGGGTLDVWYTFTAPASGIAIIETTAGTLNDAAMALYSATACNGTFTLVSCDDDNGPGDMPLLSFTNLAPGQTYYLRVWGYGSASGSFNLCVHGPASVPAGGCVYMLRLNDTGNNGWGSSTVGVSINGGPFTNYTCTGSLDIFLIGVNIGQVLVINYTASGPNQTQNSYVLSFFPGSQSIFASGSPPAAGISFTQTVTCNPPPPPSADCAGGSTICGGQSFNNNASGAGNVVDLIGANQGCLATGEHQGTWYRFSPSTSGTIGLTIAPSLGTTDYDFGIWGPYSTVVCPPTGPPLRCSYAAATGNTGLGNGATDLTEGAGGDKWVQTINAIAGQIYIMYIDNYSSNNQSFTLTWQLGGGSSLDCTVLPVELTSLQAVPLGPWIDVIWTTATEHNSHHFDVERSLDGMFFERIGTVDAAGDTEQGTRYVFTDRTPTPGLNYYRLIQVDKDGSAIPTHIVTAEATAPEDALLLFPNPGEDQLSVMMPVTIRGAMAAVRDVTGRILITASMQGDRCLLNTMDLPAGIYTVELLDASGAQLGRGTWIKRWGMR